MKTPNEKIFKYNNMKQWDVILANPPYDNGLGDLFLSKMLTLANTICTVQPSTWIFSKNNKRNCIKEIYNICKNDDFYSMIYLCENQRNIKNYLV